MYRFVGGTLRISEDITMKTLQSGLAVAMLAAGFIAPGTLQFGQANAAPIFIPKIVTAQSDVIQVRDGRWRRGWHNGYRGYPRYRRGYRNYNGWWYPAGAFVAGALIGGAIANSNYYGGGYYGGGYYNNYYGGGYYPRYYQPRYYAPARVYYPPRGTAYRQGYRDGFRDGANARYYDDITCTQRLQDAGQC
jgi:hypothetical protein